MNAVETLLQLWPELAENARPGPGHVMVCCPFHIEKTPSMSLSMDKPVWFCLAGETKVLTREGPREIQDLAGGTHDVLVPGGYWVPSPFRAFGEQQLWEVVVQRNGIQKVLRATAEHRWFTISQKKPRPQERATVELRKGDTLAGCFPTSLAARSDGAKAIKPSAVGVAHGFVYGDGFLCQRPGSGSVAYFYGKKDQQMRKWFPLSPYSTQRLATGERRGEARDLPRHYKELPKLDESISYIYGWLAGYFAADGSVAPDGHATFDSADLRSLCAVRDLCTRVGIATSGIKTYNRKGFNGVEALHRLALYTATTPLDFYLLKEHRARIKRAKKGYERRHWRVVSVHSTPAMETVYCATVPHPSHAFALEDNILTGNCHGCKTSGHLSQLLKLVGVPRSMMDVLLPRGERSEKAKKNVAARIMKGENPFTGKFILDEEILDAYRLAPTNLLHAGYLMDTLRHFEVGYDSKNLRITYPLRTVYGDLVGISGRTILDCDDIARYKIYDRELKERADYSVPDDYTMEGVKSAILWHGHVARPLFFGKDYPGDTLIVVEGFKACMWTWQCGYQDVVALVGSYLTEEHAELIARSVPKVILFLDNNAAGMKGTYYGAKALMRKGVEVRVAQYPDDRQQPDNLAPEEIDEALDKTLSIREWRSRYVIHEDAPVAASPRI